MVAGPHRDAEAVQHLGHVVGMPRQVERDDAAALVGGRAVQLDPGHLARKVSSA